MCILTQLEVFFIERKVRILIEFYAVILFFSLFAYTKKSGSACSALKIDERITLKGRTCLLCNSEATRRARRWRLDIKKQVVSVVEMADEMDRSNCLYN